jgi:uncharacterized coiled-coil protein SlyX
MDSDNRIIELLSEMVFEQKETNKRLDKILKKMDNNEEYLIKTNLAIGELNLSVDKLSERLEKTFSHEKRIEKLEQTVFGKTD